MTAGQRALALLQVGLALSCVVLLVRRRIGLGGAIVAGSSAAASLLWLFTSEAYEGPAVLSLTSTMGLTLGDMGVPTALALAVAVLYRVWRDARSAPDRLAR